MKNRVNENIVWLKTEKTLSNKETDGVKSEWEQAALIRKIKRLLFERDAVLIAHYYVDSKLQDLAEQTDGFVGDSLEMAKFGKNHPAKTLIVSGVRFMGETAKIISPDKRVLVLDKNAECSLDLSAPIDEFGAFCDTHPDRTVVVYANTSAAVKARADWVVTSSIAVDVIRYLHQQGKKIIWGPDKHLGRYIQQKTNADMILWDGACVVHETFNAQALKTLKEENPEAAILVHPESPADVIALADVVGSTSQLIDAAVKLENRKLIVATDNGILHKMKSLSPFKDFVEAPTAGAGATCESCAHCPWMAMNNVNRLYKTILNYENEIFVDEPVRQQAIAATDNMLRFKEYQLAQG